MIKWARKETSRWKRRAGWYVILIWHLGAPFTKIFYPFQTADNREYVISVKHGDGTSVSVVTPLNRRTGSSVTQ